MKISIAIAMADNTVQMQIFKKVCLVLTEETMD